MLKKTAAIAALAGAALLGTTPALADGYRHGHGHGPKRVVVVHKHVPYYAQRRVFAQRPLYAHRPVYARPAPVVVYRQHSSHDVLGGLIVGAVLGAVIASHGGY
jgi:hypothetical protein